MQKLRVFLLLPALLLSINSVVAAQPGALSTELSNVHALTGNVVTLTIKVKAPVKQLSWASLIGLFKQSGRIFFLACDSVSTRNGSRHLLIKFTSLKPAQVSIPALPVSIGRQKYLTRPLKLSFTDSRLALQLHDIKPNAQMDWLYPISVLGRVLSILLLLWVSILVIDHLLKKRRIARGAAAIQKGSLASLSEIEVAAAQSYIPPSVLVDRVTGILTGYGKRYMEYNVGIKQDNEIRITAGLEKAGERLSFLPAPVAVSAYADYLRQAREFIINYPNAI